MIFDNWFDQFWNMYDKKYTDNCSPKKGAKAKARAAAQTCLRRARKTPDFSSDEQFLLKCTEALKAQKKYWDDAARLKKWMPHFPMVATWFNQDRWDLELDSHAEMREKADSKPFHKAAKKPSVGKVTNIDEVRKQREKLRKMVGLK